MGHRCRCGGFKTRPAGAGRTLTWPASALLPSRWQPNCGLGHGMQGTPTLEELKLQYYRLYIQYHAQDHSYLEICRCYRAILDTPSVTADTASWQQASRRPRPPCNAHQALRRDDLQPFNCLSSVIITAVAKWRGWERRLR